MHSSQFHRPRICTVLTALVMIALIGITGWPTTLAAPPSTPMATEEVISVRRVNPPSDHRALVTSRVAVPTGSTWETDPDRGPLTLRVQTGELIALLDGGSARIERRMNLFFGPEIGPLPPGERVALIQGDRLVVVRGFHLTVENDSARPAIAVVTRMTTVTGG